MADDLTASPIDLMLARGTAGSGRVTLEQAEVRSAAFQALAKGDITLAPILTNSTLQIPVTVALSRALAGKAGLVTAATPTNAVYVALPDFLQMKGTLGQPKADVDKAVLGALALKTGAGVANKIGGKDGEKVGAVLQGLGGLAGRRHQDHGGDQFLRHCGPQRRRQCEPRRQYPGPVQKTEEMMLCAGC